MRSVGLRLATLGCAAAAVVVPMATAVVACRQDLETAARLLDGECAANAVVELRGEPTCV